MIPGDTQAGNEVPLTEDALPEAHPASSPEREVRFGLSGKLLVLTVLFVMVAEILIFVPNVRKPGPQRFGLSQTPFRGLRCREAISTSTIRIAWSSRSRA